MSNKSNDGGPAFPVCYQHENLETGEKEVTAAFHGMSLRDWFAGQERLADYDHPEVIPNKEMCEALAGEKQPEGGWSGNRIEMLRWEAKWMSAMKYIRADAMLAAREKGAK